MHEVEGVVAVAPVGVDVRHLEEDVGRRHAGADGDDVDAVEADVWEFGRHVENPATRTRAEI